jgi:hypothetical protein
VYVANKLPDELTFPNVSKFQVAGVAATTEQIPSAPNQGTSTLQRTDDSQMSVAAAENAG